MSRSSAPDRDPALRRRAVGPALTREASQTLVDIWNHWPPSTRHVFAAVAVEHLDALGARVGWSTGAGLVADPATFPEELYALERHGFVTTSPHTPSGYLVCPLAFLAWCAVQLRGHAQSAQEWSRWLDAELSASARQRHLWDAAIRPRAAVVRTDLDALLAAHAGLSEAAPAPRAEADAPRPSRRVRAFFSYAASDEAFARRLEAHLSALVREGLLETFSTRDVLAGDVWRSHVDAALAAADIVLLLVSADFIASDYCFGVELARAKERADRHEARVLPVHVRPADLGGLWIRTLAALPEGGRAVTAWPDPEAAWAQVAAAVRWNVEQVAEVLAAPPRS